MNGLFRRTALDGRSRTREKLDIVRSVCRTLRSCGLEERIGRDALLRDGRADETARGPVCLASARVSSLAQLRRTGLSNTLLADGLFGIARTCFYSVGKWRCSWQTLHSAARKLTTIRANIGQQFAVYF